MADQQRASFLPSPVQDGPSGRHRLELRTPVASSVIHLRLHCSRPDLLHGLEQVEQCCNLEGLHISVYGDLDWESSAEFGTVSLALERVSAKSVGLHVFLGEPLRIPECNVVVVDRTCFFGYKLHGRDRIVLLEDHMDYISRRRVIKLTLHVRLISSGPGLSGFLALKELVIADSEEFFGTASTLAFSLKYLDVVAATLKHLTVSSNSAETYIVLPQGMCLRSFVCVCRGHLLLHCDSLALSQGLEDLMLGYTTITGTGVGLVENAPRLGEAVLEVLGPQVLRQRLFFSRPGLVGEWWHGVFQISKQQFWAKHWCWRVRVWAQGHVCPQYLTFPRYGVNSAHEDREVLH